MTPEDFVRAIEIAVRDSAVSGVAEGLAKLEGRKISDFAKARHEWAKSLDAGEKEFLNSVIVEAVDNAVFGFLCVLDGVRAIEDTQDKGDLVLVFRKDGETILNSEDGEMLHDIFEHCIY